MPFLPPNQQRQRTEGIKPTRGTMKKMNSANEAESKLLGGEGESEGAETP